MRAYQVQSHHWLESIKAVDLPEPSPGPGEVKMRVRATSLNFRDTIIPKGGYPRNQLIPVIPLSDGAGEVVEVGEGVTRFEPGDRVMPNFLREWITGPIREEVMHTGLGGSIDGTLAEYVVFPQESFVRIPEHLSWEEAATLPCAALTAWNALSAANTKAGDTVLLLGTGGVSVFALQLAKAMGARAIMTSSSDEKLKKVRQLGADETINYESEPDWHKPVREMTGGLGVDHVVEVGGPGTLERSMQAVRVGGTISLIGLLEMPKEQPLMLPILLNAILMRGIYVGSAWMFEAMNRAVSLHKIKPVIDRTFKFDGAIDAYKYVASQAHVGKVVITVD